MRGCRIGLAETVNGLEWTGSDRRTHRRKPWWSPVASPASPSPTPQNPRHRQIDVVNLYIRMGSDWKNLPGTAQFLSTQTDTTMFALIYRINSVSLSVCRGPETHITFNKIVPPNLRAQKLLRTSSSYFYFYVRFRAATAGGLYFLLLLLRSFPRNNCRRRWGRYFWDLEGGWGNLGALFLV
jgi:hypothetical protein